MVAVQFSTSSTQNIRVAMTWVSGSQQHKIAQAGFYDFNLVNPEPSLSCPGHPPERQSRTGPLPRFPGFPMSSLQLLLVFFRTSLRFVDSQNFQRLRATIGKRGQRSGLLEMTSRAISGIDIATEKAHSLHTRVPGIRDSRFFGMPPFLLSASDLLFACARQIKHM